MENKKYRVLLYYKYTNIDDYKIYRNEHLAFCKRMKIKGRILISPEGINGTCAGTFNQTERYMEYLQNDPRFSGIVFKMDYEDVNPFDRIHVRAKNELVTFNAGDDLNPLISTGTHLKPSDFNNMLKDPNVIVLDGRNDYEWDLGHFRNAIRPEIKNFREFPEFIRKNLSQYKDKKVITYCTGGVRCEKLTSFMIKEGFKDVYQLDGGIVTYGKDEDVKGDLFDGKCYVFDERISVGINRTESNIVVSKCLHCGELSDRYVNCANPECNLQYFCCVKCEPISKRSCSDSCREHPRNRYESA